MPSSSRPEPAAGARSPAVGGGRTRFRPCPDSCLTAQPTAGADGASRRGSPRGVDVEEMRNLQSHPKRVTLLCVLWYLLTWTRSDVVRQERR